jgi:hypothetical protein
VLTPVFLIVAAVGALAALYYLAAAGLRHGDRPGDALVTAVLTAQARPDETCPLLVVTVRNPSGTPVLAALRVRRALVPALLAEPHGVTVPLWTLRRKFRPAAYGCVGVVAAGGTAELAVPVPARARRYALTAAVGQEGSRLRVHRLRLGPASYAADGRDESIASCLLP